MALSSDQLRLILEIQTIGREQVEQVRQSLAALGISTRALTVESGGFSAELGRLGDRLQRQLSLTGLLSQSIRRVGNIFQTLALGAFIGAFAAFADEIARAVTGMLGLETATQRANKELEKLSQTNATRTTEALRNVQIEIEGMTNAWSRMFSLSRFKNLFDVIRDLGASATPIEIHREAIRRLEKQYNDLRDARERIRTQPQSVIEAQDRGRFAAAGLGAFAQEIGDARASGDADRQQRLNAIIKAGAVAIGEYNAVLAKKGDTVAASVEILARATSEEQRQARAIQSVKEAMKVQTIPAFEALGVAVQTNTEFQYAFARAAGEGADQMSRGRSIVDSVTRAHELGAIGFDVYVQALDRGIDRMTALELGQQAATSETDRQRIAMESLQQAMQIGTIPAYEALGRAIQKGTDFSIEYQQELGKALTQEQIAHVIVNESIRQRRDLLSLDERYTEQLYDLVPVARARNETEQEQIFIDQARATSKSLLLNLDHALVSSAQQAILGTKSFGKALKEAVSQELAAVAARAAVNALYYTGMGFAALALGPIGGQSAAFYFKAAAILAGVAAVAGVAARGLGGGAQGSGGGSGGGSGRSVSDEQRLEQLRQVRAESARDERLNRILDEQQGITRPGEQRVTIDINLGTTIITDERAAMQLANLIVPAIAKNLEENDFNLGNIQLAGTRR